MNLPKLIHVMGTDYTVEEIENLSDEDGRMFYGKIQHTVPRIQIENTLADSVKVQSLLHEAFHGLFHHGGHIDLEHEERIAWFLGCQLPSFVRANKALFQMILNEG